MPSGFDVDKEIEIMEKTADEMAGGGLFTSDAIVADLMASSRVIEQGAGLLPSLELGLFSAGRISYPALQARLSWKLRAYLERDKPKACSLSFSLVPSNIRGLEGESSGVRGQWLIMSIKYVSDFGERFQVDMNACRFMFADSVGGDDLERPPNGHATPVALQRCRKLIPESVHEVVDLLRHQAGNVAMIQFGQGLIDSVDAPDFVAGIEAVSPGTNIIRSPSTFASEEAGGAMGGQQCAQQ